MVSAKDTLSVCLVSLSKTTVRHNAYDYDLGKAKKSVRQISSTKTKTVAEGLNHNRALGCD